MIQKLLLISLLFLQAYAIEEKMLYGSWSSNVREESVQISEYISLKDNKIFSCILTLDHNDGILFIENLKVLTSGEWKFKNNVLTYITKDVEFIDKGKISLDGNIIESIDLKEELTWAIFKELKNSIAKDLVKSIVDNKMIVIDKDKNEVEYIKVK